MGRYHWANAPSDLKGQVRRLISGLQHALSDNIVGVYLHGSLAMGCFNPLRSDVDLLVAIREGMSSCAKLRLAHLLLGVSRKPYPLEVSFLAQADLTPCRFPTPFAFHYSEMWRQHFSEQLTSNRGEPDWGWEAQTDPDLAAHITILHHRGVALLGAPIQAVFPPVPSEDYLAAIWEHDAKSIVHSIERSPIYGVLNLCRVLWYVCDGTISSKEEAGIWAAAALPEGFQELVRHALELYRGNTMHEQFDASLLKRFAAYMYDAIGSEIEARGSVNGKEVSPTTVH